MQNESLGKSFYSLSFNFQKVSNFTQSIITTIKQSINLFIITFQNLEFWDVTLFFESTPKAYHTFIEESKYNVQEASKWRSEHPLSTTPHYNQSRCTLNTPDYG